MLLTTVTACSDTICPRTTRSPGLKSGSTWIRLVELRSPISLVSVEFCGTASRISLASECSSRCRCSEESAEPVLAPSPRSALASEVPLPLSNSEIRSCMLSLCRHLEPPWRPANCSRRPGPVVVDCGPQYENESSVLLRFFVEKFACSSNTTSATC